MTTQRTDPVAVPSRSISARSPRTLIIGLGNPLLTDDGVGLRVAQHLHSLLAHQPGVEIVEDHWGGLRLMERMVGYERAIVVDAICTGQSPPGTIRVLAVDDIPTQRSDSAHDVHLPAALELGRQSGAALPANDDIRLVAIEAAEVITFSEDCTPLVEASIERAAQVVLGLLASWRQTP